MNEKHSFPEINPSDYCFWEIDPTKQLKSNNNFCMKMRYFHQAYEALIRNVVIWFQTFCKYDFSTNSADIVSFDIVFPKKIEIWRYLLLQTEKMCWHKNIISIQILFQKSKFVTFYPVIIRSSSIGVNFFAAVKSFYANIAIIGNLC